VLIFKFVNLLVVFQHEVQKFEIRSNLKLLSSWNKDFDFTLKNYIELISLISMTANFFIWLVYSAEKILVAL